VKYVVYLLCGAIVGAAGAAMVGTPGPLAVIGLIFYAIPLLSGYFLGYADGEKEHEKRSAWRKRYLSDKEQR
jgi:hypothetical protein